VNLDVEKIAQNRREILKPPFKKVDSECQRGQKLRKQFKIETQTP